MVINTAYLEESSCHLNLLSHLNLTLDIMFATQRGWSTRAFVIY